jgi:ABC-type branched-subunit amino acid transport system ATPase component
MSETILACSGVSVRFGGLFALNQLDLTIERGKVIGLIGPNGSGKTTFFNVISGVYPASDGKIQFEGRDVTAIGARELAKRGLARTFQRARLCLPLTVFDNVILGAHGRLNSDLWHNIIRRKAFQTELAAMTAEVRDLLAVFDTRLADKILDPAISLGMIDRRRVEICRALLGRPSLLLLDEPSAGMTHDETSQLMDEILGIRARFGNPTVILVEHDMGLIERITDHCIVLNYGKKIAEGVFSDVAADQIVRQAYLGQS